MNSLYFIVPALNFTYTVRQDYNLDKYPFMEKTIQYNFLNSTLNADPSSITSCVDVYQDTYFVAGHYSRLIRNIPGS